MNKCVTLAAIAVFSSGAFAGPAESFSLTMDVDWDGFIDPGNAVTISIDILGDSSFGTHLLGGQFGLATSGATDFITDIRWTNAEWSTVNDPGEYDGNGNYGDVIFGQFVVFTDLFDFPPGAGSELGQVIGSFEIDLAPKFCGKIDFSFTTDPDPERFALQAVDVDFVARTVDLMSSSEGELLLNGASVFACPSPSGVALLGFGGLAITRRRR